MTDFFMDLSNVVDDDLLPKGDYQVESVNAELKQTKAGDGSYLAIEFAVISGQYRGWKIYDNINVKNPNPQAVEIGQRKLKKLLKAAGSNNFVVRSIRDVIGLRVIANVDVRKDANYGDSNVIKFYSPIAQNNQQGVSQPAQQNRPQPNYQQQNYQQYNAPTITTDDIPF